MFRRRGCLFGCGSILLVCVVAGLIGWFVAIPRLSTAFEDSVRDGLATVIADAVNPLYSRSQLQDGESVRFPFDVINQNLAESNQDAQVDSFEVTTSGNQIVMRAVFNSQEMEIGFVPEITQDGRLNLEPVDEGGWWQQQLMTVLGGGFEASINDWLDLNGLILTDIELEPDAIILIVTGQ